MKNRRQSIKRMSDPNLDKLMQTFQGEIKPVEQTFAKTSLFTDAEVLFDGLQKIQNYLMRIDKDEANQLDSFNPSHPVIKMVGHLLQNEQNFMVMLSEIAAVYSFFEYWNQPAKQQQLKKPANSGSGNGSYINYSDTD